MSESRTLFLEHTLTQKGMHKAIEALDLMKNEMCAAKGFARHNGDNYYFHLVDVAQDLLNHGVMHEACIIAALLHDYQEDVVGVTKKMIGLMFGEEVAIYVDILSKKNWIDYKIPYNMEMYLDDISCFLWTALIKTADRKHNFSTLKDATFEKRMKQAVETETFFIPFFKEMRNKYPRQASFFYGAKTHIMPTLLFIKEYQVEIDKLKTEILELKNEVEVLENDRD